jgi:MFS family permease
MPSRDLSVEKLPSLWRHRDFMVWWLGQSVSLFGTAFTTLAMPITAAVYLHASAAQMGFLFAAQFAPQLLIGLPAGVWLDRSRRRPVLVAGQLLSAAALATVPLAAVAGVLRIEQLYVVGALVGTAQTLAGIAQNSFLPTLVGRDQLVEANSKLYYSRTLASLIGPGLAGLAVQLLSAPKAIAFDAASFVVGAVTAARLRTRERAPVASGRHPLAEAREGLAWLWREPVMRAITLSIVFAQLGGTVVATIFVLLFVTRVGITPLQLGIVFAVGSLSSLVGGRLAQPLVRRGYLGTVMVAGAVLPVIGQILDIPAALGPQPLAFPLLIAGSALSWFGLMAYNVNQQAIRQAMTPDRLMGRAQSGVFVLAGITQVAGALLGGTLGQTAGLVPTLVVGIVLTVLWGVATLASPLRSLREVPQSTESS